MQELLRAGLVPPIEPDHHRTCSWNDVHDFFDFVDADPEIAARRANWGGGQAPRGSAPAGTMAQIQRGKIGHMVADELEMRGLARQEGRDWYAIESRTAAAYMCFLAGALGRLPGVDMDPITDGLESLSPLAGEGGSGMDALHRLRLPVLEELLPAPEEGIEVSRAGPLQGRTRR